MESALHKKILIVDDVHFVLDLQQQLFGEIQKELGITLSIKTASNVKKAIERLHQDQFDLLITDMHLPDGTGAEIAEEALALSSGKTTVVALTSMPTAFEDKRELFYDFITKPTDPKQIKEKLTQLVKA